MKGIFKREKAIIFSKNKYELLFSVFMFFSLFLLKDNLYIRFPYIFYSILAFLIFNFIVNRYIKAKNEIDIWLYSFINLLNSYLIFSIILYSGGKNSYFWFVFLFPIMEIALTSKRDYFYLILFNNIILLILLYSFDVSLYSTDILLFFIKAIILAICGIFILNFAIFRKSVEVELSFKRKQMDELLSALKKADINVGYQDDKYNFLATMLHDLKNLITIIYLLSQIIEKSEFAENEDIQKIYKASKMAARLSQYAMASLKDLQLKLEKADLAEVLDEALEILEYKFYSKNIKLNKNYEKNIFFAEIDKTQFTRVIINIILNSISIIDSKNGEISVSLSKKDKIIRLVFTDNGPGFPKEIIDGIKPYNTTRSDIGGTGLGLYSSMNIIKKLNGNLEISNQEKKGAKVSIELPELI